jgi:hypothetical protein
MGGEEEELLLILNLCTRWGWVVSITPRPRFTPRESTPGTHCTGGWVGPRAGLDAGARRKTLCPCRGSNPDRPARRQTIYWLSYRGSFSVRKCLDIRMFLIRVCSWWSCPSHCTALPSYFIKYCTQANTASKDLCNLNVLHTMYHYPSISF